MDSDSPVLEKIVKDLSARAISALLGKYQSELVRLRTFANDLGQYVSPIIIMKPEDASLYRALEKIYLQRKLQSGPK